MKLIVITSGCFFDGEPEAINRLFGYGMETLHVRKPQASFEGTRRFVEQIDATFHPRTVIHDYYELTRLFHLKGIHLNRRNRNVPRPCFPPGDRELSVSRSCHSLEEVAAVSAGVDYMFLSPVFDSISKAGYKQGYTPEQLCDARDRGLVNTRVMALGGITAERIPAVRHYGFGGVAVLGALWTEAVTDGDTDELRQRFDALRTACRDDGDCPAK
ncbi:MAG: thiamine phosphate synthase [Tannerella sp.]|jgi:thiamine-phosphate pyrophosphorylase|nr:thiamine phosphate synthase [Tannerella sp.]